jgi:hypothetical protein
VTLAVNYGLLSCLMLALHGLVLDSWCNLLLDSGVIGLCCGGGVNAVHCCWRCLDRSGGLLGFGVLLLT